MYFEPWQVFLVGCIVGTLISFIVLTLIIINTIGRIGIKGIHFHEVSNNPNIEDLIENSEDQDDVDLLARLSFVLSHHGLMSQNDIDFVSGNISIDDWKKIADEEFGDDEDSEDV